MKAGWRRGPLREFAELVSTGPFGSMLHKADYVSEGVPLINPTNIEGDSIVPDLDKRVGSDALKRLSKYVLKTGDVVVGRRGEIGRCAVIGVDEAGWVCGTGCFFVRPGSSINPHFLAYLLRSPLYRGLLEKASTGATMQNMSNTTLAQLQIVVPDRSEQQRIIAILDEAFKGIATAQANAEKNLQNTHAFLESHLAQSFSAFGNGWSEQTLGEACSIARGGSPRPIKEFFTKAADGVNWVKISDATASAKYIFSTAEKIKSTGVSRSRLVRDGDFLLSNSMSFGRPYIMRTTGCIHDGWLVLSDYQDSFDQDFLYLLLGSKFVYRQFDRLAAGSTVRNLNIDLASSVRVPVPPMKVQVQMAAELGEVSEGVDQLTGIFKRKLAALDELKKSLLHQAFSGRL